MASSFRNYEKDFYRKKYDLNNPKTQQFQDITIQGNNSKSRSKPKDKSTSKDKRIAHLYQKQLKFQRENKQFPKNNIVNNFGSININVNNLIISNPPSGGLNNLNQNGKLIFKFLIF